MVALLSIPNTPDDITPQWLTEALYSTGTPPDIVVTSLYIEPIAEFTCAGQLARLHLSFSQPQLTLPNTLVVKLHAPDELLRVKTRPFTPDKREVLFYQQLARETHLRTPHCYYNAMNVSDGKYVRILEDLAPAKSKYTFDDYWEDYRFAMLRYFVQAVLMVTSLNPENDRENRLAHAVSERFIAAITDLRLIDG